jgi:hypothetical protein
MGLLDLRCGRHCHIAGFTALALLHATVLLSVQNNGFSIGSSAQAAVPPNRIPRVFLVPIQRVDDTVPTAVASQAQNILSTLFSVQSSMVFLRAKGVMGIVDSPEETKADASVSPVLAKADSYFARGMVAGQSKRWNQALRHLSMAKGLYEQKLGELNDFNKLVETLLWLARAQIGKGQTNKAYALVQQVVAYRPEYIIDSSVESPSFVRVFNRASRAVSGARTGTVVVTCLVSECTIFVNGVPRGTGSVTVRSLAPGKHVIRAIAPGYRSWSMQVKAPDYGRTRDLLANLRSASSKQPSKRTGTSPSSPRVEVEQLESFVQQGDFQARFRQAAEAFCTQHRVNYLVTGALNRSSEGYVLATFLYSAAANVVVPGSQVTIQQRLSTMQTELMPIQKQVLGAVRRFPKHRRLTRKPSIYRAYSGSASSVAASTQPILPPPQEPEIDVDDSSGNAATDTVPIYRPQPIYQPTEDTTIYQPEQSDGVVLPEKRPMVRLSSPFIVLERSIILENRSSDPIWYKTWWFWTAVGVVVAGSVTTGVLMGSGQDGSGGWSVKVQIP